MDENKAANAKKTLIDQIEKTYNVPKTTQKKEDGTLDFRADDIEHPVSREDITFLVNKYIELLKEKVNPNEAVRLTYGCLYKQSDIRFDPHSRIAELKKGENR